MIEDSDGAVARAGILKKPVTDVGGQRDNGIRKQGKNKDVVRGLGGHEENDIVGGLGGQ